MVRYKRRRSRNSAAGMFRLIKRYPLLSFAVFISVWAGIGVDAWLSLEYATQSYVTLAVFCLVCVVYALAKFEYGAIYVIEGLHPITGRLNTVYVGLTTQQPWYDKSQQTWRYPRIEQHLLGSDRYGAVAKPWADTVTGWYIAHESKYFVPAVLSTLEAAHIRLRKPLYNHMWNLNNRYRIDKRSALLQREERDRGVYTSEYYEAMRDRSRVTAVERKP